MNNSLFGKSLENIRDRVDIRLISFDKVAQKLAAKPIYVCCTIFDENLIAIHMNKTKLYFNKPVHLGISILDLSNVRCTTFITTILGPSMEIRQNYPSPTLTLSHMKLRTTFYTKISTPTIEKRLTQVTTRVIIHLELKQDLIVKCLDCLRMKLVGSRFLNLLT